MKRFLITLFVIILTASMLLAGVGCKKIEELAAAKASLAETTATEITAETTSTPETTATETTAAVPTVTKEVSTSGEVTLGKLASDRFTLLLPAGAYTGQENIALTIEESTGAPEMPNAEPIGEAFSFDSGGPQRLNDTAVLTYKYDPQKISDPLLLCLGYYDGAKWHYLQADAKDEAAHTVTFHIYHFSTYYPAQFKSELEAAKYYAQQMAAQKVLGEGGGDTKTASRAVADMLAEKLGLGESEFAKKMLADIAADQDIMKVFDECQQDGWSNTGYEKVMNAMCNKIADHLIENRTGLTAEEGAVLTAGEQAFKQMGDLIKVTDSGSKLLGAIAGGDSKAAGKELLNFAADNTGAYGKALKYTLQGMQNALDAWRDGEVQKAFQVYKEGSSGSLFGYGAIEALDFDAVWENMKGASRQLCIERIATENDARSLCGIEPLSAAEEDFYREKVKLELRTEFERRVVLQDKIDKEKKNLDLIFEELDKGDMLDSSKVWYRGFGGKEETLQSRMGRMEHLIQRIYRDLGIKDVYGGPQNTRDLNGSISAAAMSEMVREYFAADTQEEAVKALKEYYEKSFDLPETTETEETIVEEDTTVESDANLIHGVVPTKVTAIGASSDGTMTGEFWNVGKLGGEQYAKAKFVFTNNGESVIWEGTFTGGPNGEFDITATWNNQTTSDKGYLKDGKTISDFMTVNNPEAFDGWVD